MPGIALIIEVNLLGQTAVANDSPTGFFGILLSGGLVGILILLVLAALSITAAYLLFDQVMPGQDRVV